LNSKFVEMAKSNSRKLMEIRKASNTRTIELTVAMYDSVIYSELFREFDLECQEKMGSV